MDDLAGTLNELLQNPAIANLLGQFGASPAPAQEAQGAPRAAAPEPQTAAPAQAPPAGGPPGFGLDPDIMQTIMKIAPMLSKLHEEDDNTRFLHALRPMLGEERQKKLDEATKLMQLMKMLPLLKNSGIL